MEKGTLIAKLYQSPKTILSNKDLALIWQENNQKNLNAKTAYYVKHKTLTRLTRGVFSKLKNYSVKELATSLYTPSYISFETILREAGVIFQHYDTLFIATNQSKTITLDQHPLVFRKLKNAVLFNPAGIIHQNNYSIATTERAFLDMLYLFPNYYFDNLSVINWARCDELAPLYHNQQLLKRLHIYHTKYAQ